MSDPRTFYGGASLGQSTGEIGGDRHYDGAAPSMGIWKCPSCRMENEGPFEQGCVHCGAGKPGVHVGHPPPPLPLADARSAPNWLPQAEAAARMAGAPAFRAVADDLQRGADLYSAALAWDAAHEGATPVEAFVAGYRLAHDQLAARTMKAPPVTADVLTLTPEGKARRTILAALRLTEAP